MNDMQIILSYLASQILINNGGRPGMFTNAKLHEYQKKTVEKTKKGTYILIYYL